MNSNPSIVIVSSSNTKPTSLIKLLTNTNSLNSEENCTSCPWKIATKYYTADVNLIGITETYVRTPSFNSNVEALIIHMDSNRATGLTDLSAFETIEKECEPEVKLLVANYCTETTKITRTQATEWCSKRNYELVELFPDKISPETDVEDDEELIKEKTGVDRVVEVLETHVWPNLVMRGSEASVESDLGVDEFADLFQQLHVMKESVQGMGMQQRKQCAEQMVTAFWRAIGGDEEEIVDL